MGAAGAVAAGVAPPGAVGADGDITTDSRRIAGFVSVPDARLRKSSAVMLGVRMMCGMTTMTTSGVLRGYLVIRTQVAQQGDLRDTRKAGDRFLVAQFIQPAEYVHLAVHEAHIVLNFAAADDRLVDTSDAGRAGNR